MYIYIYMYIYVYIYIYYLSSSNSDRGINDFVITAQVQVAVSTFRCS